MCGHGPPWTQPGATGYSRRDVIIETENLSKKKTIQVSISILHALEEVHRAGWLHLNMKPINICVCGTEETRHKVFLVDFRRAER